MSSEKIDQLFGYVQERCLWQFFSRSWDRQENIDGIVKTATEMLTGEAIQIESPMDRLFYADAKIMVSDFRERFPWIQETGHDQSATYGPPQGEADRIHHHQVAQSRTQPFALLSGEAGPVRAGSNQFERVPIMGCEVFNKERPA